MFSLYSNCNQEHIVLISLFLYLSHIKRRMRYIDEDLQNRRKFNTNKNVQATSQGDSKNQCLPTTPFTVNELQNIELQNSDLKKNRSKIEESFNTPRHKVSIFKVVIFFVSKSGIGTSIAET
jgi:hypothetical protein